VEQKLLARLKSMEFKPEDVDVMITTSTLDFLPNGN
jgi:hypothetical protein